MCEIAPHDKEFSCAKCLSILSFPLYWDRARSSRKMSSRKHHLFHWLSPILFSFLSFPLLDYLLGWTVDNFVVVSDTSYHFSHFWPLRKMFFFMLMSLKGCFSICWFLDTSTAFDTDHFEIIVYVDFRFHSPVFSGSFCLWIGWLPKVTTFLASHLKNNSLYLLFSTSNCRQSYVSSRATWTQLRPSLSSFSDISVQYYVTVCWNTFPNSGAVLLKPVVFSFINQLLIHLSETHLKPEMLYASVFFFFGSGFNILPLLRENKLDTRPP